MCILKYTKRTQRINVKKFYFIKEQVTWIVSIAKYVYPEIYFQSQVYATSAHTSSRLKDVCVQEYTT